MGDDFDGIVTAIEQGRTIHANIGKSLRFLLATNVSEILVTLGGLALGIPRPMSAMQFLWINLLSDVAPALALAVEPEAADVMTQPPRDPHAPMLSRTSLLEIARAAAALPPHHPELPSAVNHAVFLRGAARRKAGGLDAASYASWYAALIDLSLRMAGLGWPNALCETAFVARSGEGAPLVPVYANVTAAPVADVGTIKTLLVEQVTGRVRWRESVIAMFDAGVHDFTEFGGKVLGAMVKRSAPDANATSVITMDDIEALLKEL